MRQLTRLLFLVIIPIYFTSCESKLPKEVPLTKYDTIDVANKAKDIRKATAITLEDGLKLTLWASDSLAPDPIAMSIDNQGNVYLTRTNRQKNSEFDIRGHRDWMIESISLTTVEERRAFLKKTFSKELSEKNSWLKDLNRDSIHDWRDLAVEQDEIWKLQDLNSDGYADVSKRILSDFNEEITDVAGALLVREKDVFVGIGPDMWRLTDTNKDEVLDTKTSISHGYGVHIGFSGHGMSGAIQGPDGKIYWGIGDIGANITSVEGKNYKYPNQGVLVRSNPDGTNFEVFAAGLRNVHEFVFDEYGNIIGADNDGDHGGERERLVHIVEGHDAGWRANWQYGKYVDPKNNSYKVWMDEKLHLPRWDGQAAYIIPPIINFHNGPTGMTYNPGTALGKKWNNHFFLVEFVGNPTRSHIWAFDLMNSGASFKLKSEKDVLSGILPTGIRFGPDGALYIADWINGWGTKDYGRVWKMDLETPSDFELKLRAETEALIKSDFTTLSTENLLSNLAHTDMRVRQKAQFELVDRNNDDELFEIIKNEGNQMARIHAVWGIGQLAVDNETMAKNLSEYLGDKDSEINAQILKVLGDIFYVDGGQKYIEFLSDKNPRVQFYAAQAVGRIKLKAAVDPLIEMLDSNDDKDLYIRHAGVIALSRIGDVESIVGLKDNDEEDLRIAAVLALRRLQSPYLAEFLDDKSEYIVTEAARAINDDWSVEEALPALSNILTNERFTAEPLIRRAINASVRVDDETSLLNLVNYSIRNDIDKELKAEAIAALSTFANPSVLDRVDGRFRGAIQRDDASVIKLVKENFENYFKDSAQYVNTGKMLIVLGIRDYNEAIFEAYLNSPFSKTKAQLIEVLYDLKFGGIEELIRQGLASNMEAVRTSSISLLNKLDLTPTELLSYTEPVFKKGTLREQQQLIKVLGKMPIKNSELILSDLIDKASKNSLEKGLIFDLIAVVDSSKSEKLITELNLVRGNTETADDYLGTLYGGNANNGRNYFYWNSSGQCVRCHAINGNGGEVGPSLDKIGKILKREQLLESLIKPSQRIAPGYGTVILKLNNGQEVSGLLLEENSREITLKTSEAEPMEIAVSRIKERTNVPSAMPPMDAIMSKNEIRNMIEFLSGLK